MFIPIKKKMESLIDNVKISETHLQQTEGNYTDRIQDWNSVEFDNFS